MTAVYKFEVVVVDYDGLGEFGITNLLENPGTTFTVLGYTFNRQRAWVDNPDTIGRKQLVQEKLPVLFPQWLPITTAPRDGTRILFFYGSCKAVFTAWFEGTTWWLMSPTDFECPAYFDCENPANCYWQPMMELPV